MSQRFVLMMKVKVQVEYQTLDGGCVLLEATSSSVGDLHRV
jgi:hypothetical protein